MDLVTPLPGRHNVYNCVAAVSVAAALDIDRAAIARGVAALSSVPGRLEPVDVGQKFAVFVDYAHTAVALENVLMTVRELTKHRVIVLFGCGGERDKSKRRRMRVAAESLADHCVVTSDNPRGEDPKAIIDQVMRGAEDLSKFTVEIDRRVAITRAIELARPGDLVLIAGKGHETVQIFKDRRVRFDDREVAREVLRKAASSAP
jgi:UDP-N-acetylmuramoyl-L-alanyl-D-glutamate--2,6-diaminopimelate ligase